MISNQDDINRQVKKNNILLYDRTAAKYGTGFNDNSCSRMSDALSNAITRGGRNRLLDIGCGTGIVLDLSIGLFDFRVGIDISMGMLQVCRKKHQSIARADCDLLPFAAKTFNVVSCCSVLHHLPEVDILFREAFRVLEPGGVFYSDYDPNLKSEGSLAGRIYLFGGYLWQLLKKLVFPSAVAAAKTVWGDSTPEMAKVAKMAEYQRHYGEGFTPDKFRRSLSAAGFEEIYIQTHDDFSSVGWVEEKKKKLKLFALLLGWIFCQSKPEFLPEIMVFAHKPRK